MKINPIQSAFDRAEDLRDELIKSFSPSQMALIEKASYFIHEGHATFLGQRQTGLDGFEENSVELRRCDEGLKILNLYGMTTDMQEAL